MTYEEEQKAVRGTVKYRTNQIRTAASGLDMIPFIGGAIAAFMSATAGLVDTAVAAKHRDGKEIAKEIVAGGAETFYRTLPVLQYVKLIGKAANTRLGRHFLEKAGVHVGNTDLARLIRRTIENIFDDAASDRSDQIPPPPDDQPQIEPPK
ncbi:MAG: hypothetical protein ACT4OY_03975 [Alphaproteobacteria bacterium]